MKVSKFVKLVGLIMALAVLPLQATYAGCGCENSEFNDKIDDDTEDQDQH